MNINRNEYLKKVSGCWMGKNIGGTVGAPFEWHRQINNISFYTQELNGEPLPNDDLDIQLLWLIAMEREGVRIDSKKLGEYWLTFIAPHWAEYGNGKINMRSGLVPPLSGSVNNDYKDSCGSFIRSEIWACLCPGNPMLAAKYAYEDSAIDHGNGEGTYAEIFTAVLESAAFVESDLYKLIDIGLHFIPENSAVTQAVKLAVECYEKKMTWQEARDEILRHHRGMAAFGLYECISQEDVDKGFFDGKLGYDVPSNIGILVLGLLYCENDFAKCMAITVNCGEDTDCTAATAGSIFGIINGIDAIPEEWIAPIGKSIKTVVLNLGDLTRVPQNIDDLTERSLKLACQVSEAYNTPVKLTDEPTDLDGDFSKILYPDCTELYAHFGAPAYQFDMLNAFVHYDDNPYLKPGESREIEIHFENKFPAQQNLEIRVFADEALCVSPSGGSLFVGSNKFDRKKSICLTCTAETLDSSEVRAVVQVTSKGRHTAMFIPILFLNGAFSD